VVSVLSDLLENENMQVRTYVNGTLYSILTRPSLRDQAQEVGLEDILKALEPRCEEQFARQIRYIIQQLCSDAMDGTASDDEEADDEEDDEEDEPEEEEEETVEAGNDMVSGEELLCGHYLASEAAAHEQIRAATPISDTARNAAKVRSPTKTQEGLSATMPRPSTPSSRPGSKDGATTGTFMSREMLARTPFTNDSFVNKSAPKAKSKPLASISKAVLSPVREDDELKGDEPEQTSPAASATGEDKLSPSVEKLNADKSLRCILPTEEHIKKVAATVQGDEASIDQFKEAFVSRPKMPRTP